MRGMQTECGCCLRGPKVAREPCTSCSRWRRVKGGPWASSSSNSAAQRRARPTAIPRSMKGVDSSSAPPWQHHPSFPQPVVQAARTLPISSRVCGRHQSAAPTRPRMPLLPQGTPLPAPHQPMMCPPLMMLASAVV